MKLKTLQIRSDIHHELKKRAVLKNEKLLDYTERIFRNHLNLPKNNNAHDTPQKSKQ